MVFSLYTLKRGKPKSFPRTSGPGSMPRWQGSAPVGCALWHRNRILMDLQTRRKKDGARAMRRSQVLARTVIPETNETEFP